MGRRSLAHQLALLVVVTALPLLLASFLMYDRLVANERERIREGLLTSAKTLAALVENEIDTYAAIGNTLAQSPNLQRGDLDAFWQEATLALKFVPGAWLTVNSPDAQQLMNTLVAPGTPLPTHATPDVIKRALSEGKIQVADLVFGPVAQKWVSFIEVPVLRDGKPLYSLSITLSPERFRSLMMNQFTRGEVVGIIDRTRKFVARIPDAPVASLAAEGWRNAIDRASEGWVESRTLEGNQSLTGYASTVHGWTVGIAVREDYINGPLNRILWWSVGTAGALIAISAFFAFLIVRRTSRGLTVLAGAARELGDGRIVPTVPTPFTEAAVIAAALSDASQELKRRGDQIARHQVELEDEVDARTRDLVAETARREESESALRHAQKMEAVGQLTGGVAHDFNNLLTVIIGGLETIQRARPDDAARIQRSAGMALQGAQRAARLTARLLAFSRRQPLSPKPVDLNTTVREMTELLHRTLGEQIELEGVMAPRLWLTEIDPPQLESAILNLAVNARDAMPEGGKLMIETSNVSLDETYVASEPGLLAGQYVMIAVSDDGAGMSRETLARVFEPFFTTKEVGKGTGLGLSMVYGFVKQSGGHVAAYSEPGMGTTIKLYFPRLFGGSVVTEEQPSPPPAQPGNEVILVVEDNEQVRSYSVMILKELGYTVLEAGDAPSALAVLETGKHIDLLFTDVVLPGMSGRVLADSATARWPGLKVLFTTGYSRNAIVHHGRLDPGVNLLTKPFTFDQLAARVRGALS